MQQYYNYFVFRNMTTVQKFCGLPNNGSYVVYEKSDKTFGRCFLWTGISYICYLIFAIVSVYILGVSKTFSSRQKVCVTFGTIILSLLSALSNLIEVILSYSLHHRQQHPPAYVLAKMISFVAWFLCFLSQCKVNSITKEKKQYNKYLMCTFLLVIFSSSMQLQFVLQNITEKDYSLKDIPLDYFGVMVDFAINILFFVSCIGISLSKITSVQSYSLLPDDNIVGKIDKFSYQEIDIYLGLSEATNNVFSKLVYWWSDRLLRKGNKEQLKTPDDLFFLPQNMNTIKMKALLMEKLKREKEKLLNGLSSDESVSHQMTKQTVKISLAKVLNRCFGKVYYSIGILKLFTNVLQLVQPTLVYLLVSFVSNKEVCHYYLSYCLFTLRFFYFMKNSSVYLPDNSIIL